MKAMPAEVVVIIEQSGTKGIYRVRAKIKSNDVKNKVVVRNVLGPVRVGDIIMITQHDMEAAGEID
ncbi:MAG: 30S ribosomal protein S28e [Candidatus Aenigmarchaeota archaeon]|nr:30S ribosomal protein S28e [Candidatus Aenigmarchaeota archaeon]MCK5322077.1 30S ribosomal protein S28e [Candidatus Aenigmarchaeota archaeon]